MVNKRILYVNGITADVTVDTLTNAFIPFGEVVEATIPLDAASSKNKGFGFVEFELIDDAVEALYNMNDAELFGSTITVNYSTESAIEKATTLHKKAIWDESDSYYQKYQQDKTDGQQDTEKSKAPEPTKTDALRTLN